MFTDLLVELLHGVDVGLEAVVEVLDGGQLLLDLVVLVQLVLLQPPAKLVQQQLLVLGVRLQRLETRTWLCILQIVKDGIVYSNVQEGHFSRAFNPTSEAQ